jgi:hypothetical protein
VAKFQSGTLPNTYNGKTVNKLSEIAKIPPRTISRYGYFAKTVEMALSIISVKLYCIDNISFY